MTSSVDEIAEAVEEEEDDPQDDVVIHLVCVCTHAVALCGYRFAGTGVDVQGWNTSCMECTEIAMGTCPLCGVTFQEGRAS